MNEYLKKRLLVFIEKLSRVRKALNHEQGYGKDERRVRILEEMIKEQMGHENTRSANS